MHLTLQGAVGCHYQCTFVPKEIVEGVEESAALMCKGNAKWAYLTDVSYCDVLHRRMLNVICWLRKFTYLFLCVSLHKVPADGRFGGCQFGGVWRAGGNVPYQRAGVQP